MPKNEIIENLKTLGFKEYEARVFFALLKGRPMSASEIAKECKLIRNSIYDTLKSFVEKAYCNEIETNTVLQYQLIDPDVIFDKIEKEYSEAFRTKLNLLKDTQSKTKAIYMQPDENANENDINIELIRGFNRHRMAKYVEIFKQAKHEVYGMFRLKGIVTEEIDEISKRFVKNGGRLKSIYSTNLDFRILKDGKLKQADKSDLIRLCESFISSGEELRLTKANIPNIAIFDKKIVFTNLRDKNMPKHRQADIIVRNSDYAEQLIELFRFHWDNSITLEEYKKSII